MINSRASLCAATLALFASLGAIAAEPPAPAPPTAEFINPFKPVESQTLSTPGGQDIGLLTSETGGLGADLWQGADRMLVEIVLPRVEVAAASIASADLARRVVLTRAAHPQGATAGVSVLGARLQVLNELGSVGIVDSLAAQAPNEAGDAGVIAARVDALFLQGETEAACGLAESARGRVREAAWVKRFAFCDGLAGKIDAARIGVDLLTEMGEADAAFAVLMARLVDKSKAQVKEGFVPRPVHFALALSTGATWSDATIAAAGAGVATAIAALEKAPPLQRALAAERALAADALPPAALRARYEAITITPKELAAPFSPAVLGPGPKGTAHALARLAKATDEAERGAVIAAALRQARERGAHGAVALLLRDEISALAASPTLAPHAAEFGAAEVALGETQTARRWLELMVAQGSHTGEAGLALRSLLAIASGDGELALSSEELTARASGARGEAARGRAALEVALSSALGATISERTLLETLKAPLHVEARVPLPLLLVRADRAGRRGQAGEAAILALAALGRGGPAEAHPVALMTVVQSLAAAGLARDARRIAAEALIARLP